MKLGLIVAASRHTSNSRGVGTFVNNTIASRHPDVQVEIVDLLKSRGHPLPFTIDDRVPKTHEIQSLPGSYAGEATRAWSAQILSFDAVIFVTPQYNLFPPPILLNALDHTYHEWKDKPVGIVTCGVKGGGEVADAIRKISDTLMGMRITQSTAAVAIPFEHVVDVNKRLKGDEAFLKEQFGEAVSNVVDEVLELSVNTKKADQLGVREKL